VTFMAYRDWRSAEAASDPLLERRLGLFIKILRSPRQQFALRFEEQLDALPRVGDQAGAGACGFEHARRG